jgi:hypothetical protein
MHGITTANQSGRIAGSLPEHDRHKDRIGPQSRLSGKLPSTRRKISAKIGSCRLCQTGLLSSILAEASGRRLAPFSSGPLQSVPGFDISVENVFRNG